MAKKKRKPNQKMTVEEIIQTLDDFIVSFEKVPRTGSEKENECVWYWSGLNKLGFTESMHDHHTRVYPNQDIIDRMNRIRKIQESKLVVGALTKDSNIDSGVAMKILSCKHGWIEAKDTRRIELEEKKIDMGIGDTTIPEITVNIVPASQKDDEVFDEE